MSSSRPLFDVTSPLSSTNTTGSQATRDDVKRRQTCKLDFRPDKGFPKSPLRQLFKSNEPPSEFEIITIRALITDAEARIEELHRFPTSTAASQTAELLKFIEVHKVLLSPIRHIPTEILQEIFLYCADSGIPERSVAMIPWHLAQICHRWRKAALSLPHLWDELPDIQIGHGSVAKESYVDAFTCLIQRSGTSPTLKFHISCLRLNSKYHVTGYPIVREMVCHSERIERLHILNLELGGTDVISSAFRGLKGRVPNLRNLRLFLRSTFKHSNNERLLDLFETAPALRKVTLEGLYRGDGITILLPWSQITHFEERLQTEKVRRQHVPFSSLRSVTYLDIDKAGSDGSIPPTPYKPTTLPHLRTLKAMLYQPTLGIILDSLTIPAVEVIKISYPGSLIPRLISMFSPSHASSRLQKLAYHTIPLEAGELTALLNLAPQLIELDIDIPPSYDILQLSCRKGEDMLVPMLEALYMHCPVEVEGAQLASLNNLAHLRCESGGQDTLDMSSQNTLNMLRIVFDSAENRDGAQKSLHDWSPLFNPEEAEAARMLMRWNGHSPSDLDEIEEDPPVPDGGQDNLSLHQLFVYIEQCGAITDKVLSVTNIHIELRRLIELMSADQDELIQRAMDILFKWDELLLNNLDSYWWSRLSPESNDHSLVYVSRNKHRELRNSPDALSIVYGLKLDGPFEKTLWDRI